MSKKIIIGLTGNIASGKSVVRKMLDRLGAFCIDADKLTHKILMVGNPGYLPVVELFGKEILNPNGEINRKNLGSIVFNNPEKLKQLEAIIHPYVRQAVKFLIKNSKKDVVVIEAIKLLESPIRHECNQIWVVSVDSEVQFQRLMNKRKLSRQEAESRINSQSSQQEKISQADVIINNSGTIHQTWEMVNTAWDIGGFFTENQSSHKPNASAEITAPKMIKATPKDASLMAEFFNTLEGMNLNRIDVMTMFGERAFILVKKEEKIIGIVGWQVENMIARSDKFWFSSNNELAKAITKLIVKIEEEAILLQAEVSMIFIVEEMANFITSWGEMGYQFCLPINIPVRTWKEAAIENWNKNEIIFYKKIRDKRVLRPI
jgi:dephospho-CoA kinase